MLEWSDVDIAVRDAVREFIDKEIRPHVDELESGDMEPYPIIRKLFATFGIADMARDSLNKRLARLREGGQHSEKPSSGGMFGDGAGGGMGFVVVSELCRVSMGVVTGMGVSLGLTVPTIRAAARSRSRSVGCPIWSPTTRSAHGRSPNRTPARTRSAA